MDPSEAWIGKVLFVGMAAIALWGVTALFQAKSEVARRIRIVIGVCVALVVAAFMLDEGGPVALLVLASVIGAITWIVKGAKK